MNRVTDIAADIQGLKFSEEIPARLLLAGPNGSGKTARLRAIDLAIRGFPTKDGLAPYLPAGDDVTGMVQVCFENGTILTRKTRVQRADGTIKVSNAARVAPDMGERTEAAVQARIEREVAPNVVAMSLKDLFALSPKERRRALLGALGQGGSLSVATALERVDEVAKGNAVWARLRPFFAREAPTGDGLDFLARLETAAKAAASEARAKKASAEAALGSAPIDPTVGDADGLARQLAEEQKALDEMIRGESASQATETARRQKRAEIDALRTRTGVEYPWWDGRHETATLEAIWAEAGKAATEAKRLDGITKERGVATEKALEAVLKARRAVDRLSGQGTALAALVADGDEGGACCPACGKPGWSSSVLEARLTEIRTKGREASKKATEAKARHDEAIQAQTSAIQAFEAQRDRHKRLMRDEEDLKAFRRIDAELTALSGATDQGVDPEARAALEERILEIRGRLDKALRQEGERKARLQRQRDAEGAETDRKAADALATAAGPAGVQGELLGSLMGPLEARMNRVWGESAQREGTLTWHLIDARGNPDAHLALKDPSGTTIPVGSLSGGEQATAMAAVVLALAENAPGSTTVALLEAAELDDDRIQNLMTALDDRAQIANVVLASPHSPAHAPRGWEIRNLR